MVTRTVDDPLAGKIQVEGDRVVHFSTSTTAPTDTTLVVFLPLGVSRAFVTTEEVRKSAAKLKVRLVAVDRPGVGGTGQAIEATRPDCPKEYSSTVRNRIRTHSADVNAVVHSLGATGVKVVAICAGTPYALHYVRQYAGEGRVSTECITLVTPWVSPECPHSWSLARAAADRWFFGRSFAGYIFGSMQLGFTVPLLRSMAPSKLLDVLEHKFTDSERAEIERTRRVKFDHLRFTDDTAVEAETAEEERLRDDQRASLGEKALMQIAYNADAHSVATLTDDVRVCLSGIDELELGDMLSVDVKKTVILGGEMDELVKPKALTWLLEKLPNASLLLFRDASHGGVQILRREHWIALAASDGKKEPHKSLLVSADDSDSEYEDDDVDVDDDDDDDDDEGPSTTSPDGR